MQTNLVVERHSRYECNQSIKNSRIVSRIIGACFAIVLTWTLLPTTLTAQILGVQWDWLTPTPTGVRLTDVTSFDGGVVIACGDQSTLLRSTDNGDTWSSLGSAYAFAHVGRTANTCWALSVDAQLFTSTDAGLTWSAVQVPSPLSAMCLETSGNNIVVSGGIDAVVYSTDGGATWRDKTLDLGMVAQAGIDSAGTFYVQNAQGKVVSFDADGTTIKQYPAPYNGSFTQFAVSPAGTLAMGTPDKGVFVWSKTSTFWSFSTMPLTQPIAGLASLHTGYFIASTVQGTIYTSNDDGKNFRNTSSSFAPVVAQAFTVADDGSWLGVGTDGLIIRADAYSPTWSSVVERSLSVITAVHSTSTGVLVYGCADGSLFKRNAGSSEWTKLQSPTNSQIRSLCSIDDGTLFLASEVSGDGHGLFTSTDDGVTWNALTSADLSTAAGFEGLSMSGSGTGYGISLGRLYKTLDAGATWTVVPFVVDGLPLTFDKVFDVVNASTLWCTAVGDSNLYRTTDGGATFTRINHTGFGKPLFVEGVSADVVYTGSVVSFNVSTDGGATWTRTPQTAKYNDVASSTSSGLLAAFSRDVLYLRRPTDATWSGFGIPGNIQPQRSSAPKAMAWLDNDHVVLSVGIGCLVQATLQTISSVTNDDVKPTTPLTVVNGSGILFGPNNSISDAVDVELLDATGKSVTQASVFADAARMRLNIPSRPPAGLYTLRSQSVRGSRHSQSPALLGYVLFW